MKKCKYCGDLNAPYYWIHSEFPEVIVCSHCLTYRKREDI